MAVATAPDNLLDAVNLLAGTAAAAQAKRRADVTAEIGRRRREALNLYEELGNQADFHRSQATERLVRGGRRSGKSVCVYAEVARAAMGLDPYRKYPTNRPLRIWLICYEEGNIGRTAHRLLFRRGAFRTIKDLETGELRAWRPWLPEDKAREKETRLAAPLIPKRVASPNDFTWKRKGPRIFEMVRLNLGPNHPMTGTEIHAFPSGAEVPMGDPVDLIAIDEDLKQGGFYFTELQARLSDTKGKLIWSVAPHRGNEALIRMSDRANEQLDRNDPDVEEFRRIYSQNPYIDEDEKRKRLEAWSDEERQAFDLGEFMLGAILVYPTFNMDVLGIPRKTGQTKLDEILNSRQIPANWTRYMWVDPGHAVAAAVFAAVPPPKFGDHVILYDEVYIRQCNPVKFAAAVEAKMAGHWFRAFIIDEHGSRVHEAGTGLTIRQQYSQAFKQRGLRSQLTGNGFIAGSDDVAARASELRCCMAKRPDGTTRLLVLRDALPNLESEMRKFKKKIIDDVARDSTTMGPHHVIDAAEYGIAAHPRYYPPRRPDGEIPEVVQELERWNDSSTRVDGMSRYLSGSQMSVHFGVGKGHPL